jgi:hypothetical protein
MDKLRTAEREKRVQAATEQLGIEPEQIVGFSAVTGEGRDALLESIEHLLTGD